MSTDSPPTRRAENPHPHSFWTGRSEFAVVALLYAIAVFLTVGTVTMKVMGSSVPGPQFFPVIVCILLYGSATALAINIIRHPKVADTAAHPGHGDFSPDMLRYLGDLSDNSDPLPRPAAQTWSTHSDWKTVGQVVGALVGFVLLLEILGWILCAAALFWVVARALGSTRPLFDIGLALLMSSFIQLAFNAGLGLPLPSGFVGGLF
jgi:putative tricarboxylic transport membrane protein